MLRMLAHGMLRLAPYVRKFQRMAFFQAVFWAHSSHDSYVLGANCLLFAEMDRDELTIESHFAEEPGFQTR